MCEHSPIEFEGLLVCNICGELVEREFTTSFSQRFSLMSMETSNYFREKNRCGKILCEINNLSRISPKKIIKNKCPYPPFFESRFF